MCVIDERLETIHKGVLLQFLRMGFEMKEWVTKCCKGKINKIFGEKRKPRVIILFVVQPGTFSRTHA